MAPADSSAMRFTVLDDAGSISFAGPGHALKMLAAVCARSPVDYRALLGGLSELDLSLAEAVRVGLSIFDEHCTAGEPETVRRWFDEVDTTAHGPFRVIDERSRRASLEAAKLGLAIFNLPAHRIVQVQNSYGVLLREDRGRIRDQGKPVARYYRYVLPNDWALVP